MLPGNRQAVVQSNAAPGHGGLGLHVPGAVRPMRAAPHHGVAAGGLGAKAQCAALPGAALPLRGVGVVLRKHRATRGGQGANDGAVFRGHGVYRVHEFQVFALRVVHQRHCGLRDCRKRGDFAGVVHAQLDHGNAVVGAQAQECEWHANSVVQIALGGQAGVAACVLLQDGRNHLRDRGFAVAAGHGDQRQRKLGSPSAGQLA